MTAVIKVVVLNVMVIMWTLGGDHGNGRFLNLGVSLRCLILQTVSGGVFSGTVPTSRCCRDVQAIGPGC